MLSQIPEYSAPLQDWNFSWRRRKFGPEYPRPRLELLMEDFGTLVKNTPTPKLELKMENLETLTQNTPPPPKIGTFHGGLWNFGLEYPHPQSWNLKWRT